MLKLPPVPRNPYHIYLILLKKSSLITLYAILCIIDLKMYLFSCKHISKILHFWHHSSSTNAIPWIIGKKYVQNERDFKICFRDIWSEPDPVTTRGVSTDPKRFSPWVQKCWQDFATTTLELKAAWCSNRCCDATSSALNGDCCLSDLNWLLIRVQLCKTRDTLDNTYLVILM